MRCSIVGVVLVVLANGILARGQSIDIPNPSFEEGADGPSGWVLSGSGSLLKDGAPQGKRAIVISGKGDGTSRWRTEPMQFEPKGVYRLAFMARRIEGTGAVISGPGFCNRDVMEVSDQWQRIESIFVAPAEAKMARSAIHLGQWEMKGSAGFDGVEVCRAVAVHSRIGLMEMGQGETLTPNGNAYDYLFEAPFRSQCRNYSRALESYTCGFNTDRWTFAANTQVVYRHNVLRQPAQSDASVRVSVTYHTAGELVVEASSDGQAWKALGTIGKVATQTFSIPDELIEEKPDVFVRLRATGTGGKPSANLQVGGYGYRCRLNRGPGWMCLTMDDPWIGTTQFVAVQAADPSAQVEIHSLGECLPGGRNELKGSVKYTGAGGSILVPAVGVTAGGQTRLFKGEPIMWKIGVPFEIASSGQVDLAITLGKDSPYRASIRLNIPKLHDSSFGQRLSASSDRLGLWWCSSGWKVSQSRPLPAENTTTPGMSLRLAANESEAVQLVLRTGDREGSMDRVKVIAEALSGPNGASLPASCIDILQVHYVNITRPTDPTGCVGAWPDPLPPIAGELPLERDRNQPLWIRVHAPKNTPPGTYTGAIVLESGKDKVRVPLNVEVYGFALPDRLSCTATFGFSPDLVWRYQNIKDPADRRVVLDKYFKSFASHHIAPYNPAPLDRIKVAWPKKDAKIEDLTPTFDFSAWDTAVQHALDTYHFTSFMIHVEGMGGGSFHKRYEPKLLGFAEDTPQYKALMKSYLSQLESHLKEKGWLNHAYVYWFDEPDPKDYEFVLGGFKKLKQYAPGLRRMITEQVEDGLVGGPGIWCPVSPHYNHTKAEQRRAAGESFWWYLCCFPHAPYATLFIDHPATELRVWLWQTWQNKIDGILVWESNYWTSNTAYTDKAHPQNPYTDPMSWVSGFGVEVGNKSPWGNGDGRFLYPPLAAANAKPEKPVLDGPVESIRWEMLRDGLEDYEYLKILQTVLAKQAAKLSVADRARYEKLLEVPPEISKTMTEFTTDPAPIEARRNAVARAIEELMKVTKP